MRLTLRKTTSHNARALATLAAIAVTLAIAPHAAAGEEEQAAPRKVIKMTVENWKWVPNKVKVEKGTILVLHIRSYDATHRFDLKTFGQKVTLPQSKVTEVEFLADKVGTFKWKCGRPCGDGCPKMTGKLTVYEPEPAAGE